MTSRISAVAIAALLAAASTSPAFAQARGAARAAAPAAQAGAAAITGGPIAGVCLFSNDRALAGSQVGRAAATRMQQIRAQVTAELSGEQTALQNEAKSLEAKRATMTQAQLQAQAGPLNQRAQAFEQKVSLRQRELEATGSKAINQIQQTMTPIIASVSSSRNCGLLLNFDGVVMAANPAMDLTEAVVQQLNQRMSTISFDRENLANQAPTGRR